LLNTVALWDKPAVSRRFELRQDKAAIRADWRSERRSLYCYRSSAVRALSELVQGLRARFILMSYSTDGIIPFDSLLEILADRGELSVVTQKYKRYRVSSQRPSPKSHNIEFVAIVDTARTAGKSNVEKVKQTVLAEHIHSQEAEDRLLDEGSGP
jgi:adenine-specific DNA-methyltransferase